MGLSRPEKVRTRIMMQKKVFLVVTVTGFLLVFRCLQQYLSSNVSAVRFSQNGRQLMSLNTYEPPYVYNLFNQQNSGIRLGGTEFFRERAGCFAGTDDGYVVGISLDGNLYTWKLPLVECHGENMIIFT